MDDDICHCHDFYYDNKMTSNGLSISNSQDVSLGEENVQISCVNSLDETAPQTLVYSNVRLPTEHVPLNLDPEFLVCCDCIDDCQVRI